MCIVYAKGILILLLLLLLLCSFVHTVQKQQRTLNEDYQNIKCV